MKIGGDNERSSDVANSPDPDLGRLFQRSIRAGRLEAYGQQTEHHDGGQCFRIRVGPCSPAYLSPAPPNTGGPVDPDNSGGPQYKSGTVDPDNSGGPQYKR